MRLSVLLVMVLALFCAPFGTPSALADPPDRVDHYRLLPRYSVLGQSGGFIGNAVRYRLRGEYDYVQEFEFGPFGSFFNTARFDNAEIWGSIVSPPVTIAIALDVDETLNLEQLPGVQVPSVGFFDVFLHQGFLNDGSAVDLYTGTFGPWMVLYGETEAPAGSADFFEYKIRALARTRPWADANDDGTVDAADYTTLRDADALALAELGGVTLADWSDQFGEVAPDMDAIEAAFASAFSTAAAVPEPGACTLALFGLLGFVGCRRER